MKKSNEPPFPIVTIIWDDAFCDNRWTSLDDIEDAEPVATMRTTGYLVKENKKWIYVAATVGDSPDRGWEANAIMAIPKAWVHKKKKHG